MSQSVLLAILGLPGTGKGTQGSLLSEVLGKPYFATGDLVREIVKSRKKDRFTRSIQKRYLKGIPQPDQVINKIVKRKVESLIERNGLIVDAYPLSMGQVKGLEKLVRDHQIQHFWVIYLDVEQKEIIRRLSSRRICKKCRASIVYTGQEERCVCGGKLVLRDDDKPMVVKTRIREYRKRFKHILKYYRDRSELIRINGNQSIAAVHTDIMNELRGRGVF